MLSGVVKNKTYLVLRLCWVDWIATVEDFSFKDLVEKIREKPQTLALFTITDWAIGHHRNKSQL